MSSRNKGALFQVYCDEPEVSTRPNQENASRRTANKSNTSRPVKKAPLANKENNPSAFKSGSAAGDKSKSHAAFRVFGDKQPFSEASPVKAYSSEAKQQSLGFYGAGASKKNTGQVRIQGQQQRRVGGFTVLPSSSTSASSASSSSSGLRGGDPVKRSTSNRLSASEGGLGESRLRQKASKALELQSTATTRTCHQPHGCDSPVLANISEAFSGQGGFHWSPSSHGHVHSYSRVEDEAELDTPSGPLRVLNDAAAHPSYADSPLDDTVIFRGSPIKRSRPNQQPSVEQRLRALRL